ncbi:DUF1934 domain-containing protein [Streptococcus sp. DD13]|uniref:DUF1934 domain-containing protein n=1 Tax=Streptococcus sp. DD13 TaxID=1777881 RepID=UPI00079A11F4|nr:DUF1934 domain-containing protein [Streptococcus sp. DD13]KXT78568.1 hypothetical protein STRDD13_00652 [Streptococcus sp. DD13]
MHLQLQNEIRIGDQVEVVYHTYEGEWFEKNEFCFLVYHNEDGEKVVIKYNQQELSMTRFSNPKSVMRFCVDQESLATIPTPMGLQQLKTKTSHYQLKRAEGQVQLHYDLLPMEGDVSFASYQMEIRWQE